MKIILLLAFVLLTFIADIEADTTVDGNGLGICLDTPDQGNRSVGRFEDAIKNYPAKAAEIKTVVKSYIEKIATSDTAAAKQLQARVKSAGITIDKTAQAKMDVIVKDIEDLRSEELEKKLAEPIIAPPL